MSKLQVITKLSQDLRWYLYDQTLIVESMAHKTNFLVNKKEKLVDQHNLVDQPLAVTPVMFVNNYMITCLVLSVNRGKGSHHICKIIWIYFDFLYKVNSYAIIKLTIPVNHDNMITQNVSIDLLISKCTCHLKTLSYCLKGWIIHKYL